MILHILEIPLGISPGSLPLDYRVVFIQPGMEISADIDGGSAIVQVCRREEMPKCMMCAFLLEVASLSSENFYMYNPIHPFMP